MPKNQQEKRYRGKKSYELSVLKIELYYSEKFLTIKKGFKNQDFPTENTVLKSKVKS